MYITGVVVILYVHSGHTHCWVSGHTVMYVDYWVSGHPICMYITGLVVTLYVMEGSCGGVLQCLLRARNSRGHNGITY